METYLPGERIEHKLMPGFVMTIEDFSDCETDPNRPVPHAQYQVTYSKGNTDWLCAYDVRRVA
jgi:hypothetical protein